MESNILFVGGLSENVDSNELKEMFSRYGNVIKINVIMDRETNLSRGFGFVEFDSAEDAEKAKENLDGVAFGNRNLRISFAEKR